MFCKSSHSIPFPFYTGPPFLKILIDLEKKECFHCKSEISMSVLNSFNAIFKRVRNVDD